MNAAFKDHRGLVMKATSGDLELTTVCPNETGYGRPKPFCVAREIGDLHAFPKMYAEAPWRYVSEEVPDFPRFSAGLDESKGQHTALDACVRDLRKRGGSVLCLPTGYGKTVVALAIAAELRMRTCILVHTNALKNQWKERIDTFLPGARIGTLDSIRDSHAVVAMIQTACARAATTPDIETFGLTIVDEAHHIAAPAFSAAMVGLSSRYTLGLSATPQRKDGLTKLLFWYLGPMSYSVQRTNEKNVKVRRVFYRSPGYSSPAPTLWNGKPKVSQMITQLSQDNVRTGLILDTLAEVAKEPGRCVLALTDRRDHAHKLCSRIKDMVPDKVTSLYIGGTKREDAREAAERADIIVGTYSVAHEGLDIPRLNCLFLCTPKNDVTQACGRILRGGHAQDSPLVVDFVDVWSVFNAQADKRKRIYTRSGFVLE